MRVADDGGGGDVVVVVVVVATRQTTQHKISRKKRGVCMCGVAAAAGDFDGCVYVSAGCTDTPISGRNLPAS